MTHRFQRPITREQAVILVGFVLGEIADAADMRYDDPKDKEIHDRLNEWRADPKEAWECLRVAEKA